jgi:hypothetical protein
MILLNEYDLFLLAWELVAFPHNISLSFPFSDIPTVMVMGKSYSFTNDICTHRPPQYIVLQMLTRLSSMSGTV